MTTYCFLCKPKVSQQSCKNELNSLISIVYGMNRFISTVVVAIIWMSGVPARSQDFSLFHGTWVNARFMETLKRSASLALAMNELPDHEPLWVRADSAQFGRLLASWKPGSSVSLTMTKKQMGGMPEAWVVDSNGVELWIATASPNGSYVALHPVDNIESNVYVMGKLPSRQTDPDFLVHRMIIASILVGSWLDKETVALQVQPNATALWRGMKRSVEIVVNPSTYDVYMILVDARGVRQKFLVERHENVLSLTSESGDRFVLRRQN